MDAHTQDNSITEVMFVTGKFGKPLPVVDSFLFYPKDAERVLSRAGAGDATQRSSSATTGPGNASAGKQNTTTPTTSVSSRTSSTCSVCEMVSKTAQHARAHEARRLVCPEGDKDMQEEEHRLPVCKGRPQERAMSSRGGGHRRDTDTCREHDPHQRGQEYYRTCPRVGCPTALSRRARLRRRDFRSAPVTHYQVLTFTFCAKRLRIPRRTCPSQGQTVCLVCRRPRRNSTLCNRTRPW